MIARVEVIAADILNGRRAAAAACPVALAVRRVVRPGTRVAVTPFWIGTAADDDFMQYASTPDAVRRFVRAFDSDGPDAVEPLAFELDLPRSVLPADTSTKGTDR